MKKRYLLMAVGVMSVALSGCGSSEDVYKQAYAEAMTQDEINEENISSMTDFALYDFDEDGTPELILARYTGEADADGYREAEKSCIFTCNKKGELDLVKLEYTSSITYNQENNHLITESYSTEGTPIIAYAYEKGEFNSCGYLTMSAPILYNLTGDEADTVSVETADAADLDTESITNQIKGENVSFDFYELTEENILEVLGVEVSGIETSISE